MQYNLNHWVKQIKSPGDLSYVAEFQISSDNKKHILLSFGGLLFATSTDGKTDKKQKQAPEVVKLAAATPKCKKNRYAAANFSLFTFRFTFFLLSLHPNSLK